MVTGWGSDDRTLRPQLDHFGDRAIYCAWIPWEPGDSLGTYAKRLAETYAPSGPCAIVGVSMGGMLAQEMSRFVEARAVILIASSRGPHGLPRPRWLLRFVAAIAPLPVAWFLHRGASLISRMAARIGLSGHHTLAEIDTWRSRDLLRASRAVLSWRGASCDETVPVDKFCHVHGAKDGILRCVEGDPDLIVEDGGHFISLTHPDRVNAFVDRVVNEALVVPK